MYITQWEEKNRRNITILYNILIDNVKVKYPYDLFVETLYNSTNNKSSKYRKVWAPLPINI